VLAADDLGHQRHADLGLPGAVPAHDEDEAHLLAHGADLDRQLEDLLLLAAPLEPLRRVPLHAAGHLLPDELVEELAIAGLDLVEVENVAFHCIPF
jgi:hypothetical protein